MSLSNAPGMRPPPGEPTPVAQGFGTGIDTNARNIGALVGQVERLVATTQAAFAGMGRMFGGGSTAPSGGVPNAPPSPAGSTTNAPGAGGDDGGGASTSGRSGAGQQAASEAAKQAADLRTGDSPTAGYPQRSTVEGTAQRAWGSMKGPIQRGLGLGGGTGQTGGSGPAEQAPTGNSGGTGAGGTSGDTSGGAPAGAGGGSDGSGGQGPPSYAPSGGGNPILAGVGKYVPVVGWANDALSEWQSQSAQNNVFRSIEGGSAGNAVQDRLKEANYSLRNSAVFSDAQAKQVFEGVTRMGYTSTSAPGQADTGTTRQGAIDYISQAAQSRGQDAAEGLAQVAVKSKNAQLSLTSLNDALDAVSESAQKAGVSSKMMREQMVMLTDQNTSLGLGGSAATLAAGVTKTNADLGTAFVQKVDPSMATTKNKLYMAASKAGLTVSGLESLGVSNPHQYAVDMGALNTGADGGIQAAGITPDIQAEIKKLMGKGSPKDQKLTLKVAQQIRANHPNIDPYAFTAALNGLSNAPGFKDGDMITGLQWVIEQVMGDTNASNTPTNKQAKATAKAAAAAKTKAAAAKSTTGGPLNLGADVNRLKGVAGGVAGALGTDVKRIKGIAGGVVGGVEHGVASAAKDVASVAGGALGDIEGWFGGGKKAAPTSAAATKAAKQADAASKAQASNVTVSLSSAAEKWLTAIVKPASATDTAAAAGATPVDPRTGSRSAPGTATAPPGNIAGG